MADDRLRRLERAHAADPDDGEVAESYLAERLRAGHGGTQRQLVEEHVRLLRVLSWLLEGSTSVQAGVHVSRKCREAWNETCTPRELHAWLNGEGDALAKALRAGGRAPAITTGVQVSGILALPGAQEFIAQRLNQTPVVPGSLRITAGQQLVRDDGLGRLIGDVDPAREMNGIHYDTGLLSFAFRHRTNDHARAEWRTARIAPVHAIDPITEHPAGPAGWADRFEITQNRDDGFCSICGRPAVFEVVYADGVHQHRCQDH